MRIVYCIDYLFGVGGIERVTITKANALANIEGNNIWIICLNNEMPVFPIDEKVHIVSLDINYHDHDWEMSRFQQLINIWQKKKEHRRKMKEILLLINPDIVVSTGGLEKSFLHSFSRKFPFVCIRESHFVSNYRLLGTDTFYSKILNGINYLLDRYYYIHRYNITVVLTNEDKERFWKTDNKVVVIPNPVTSSHTQHSMLTNNTVIAAGRLAKQKNFSSLLRSWKIVHQKHADWILEIWGDGTERNHLEQMTVELQLQGSARIMGVTDYVFSKMAQASVFVLSSLYEGLPLVVLEAMSCGLPVVSYACPCGPKDIITEGKDGYLVPTGDEERLAEKICFLIEHEDIRREMGKAAVEKSKQYALEPIIRQWMTLFHELTAKKQ